MKKLKFATSLFLEFAQQLLFDNVEMIIISNLYLETKSSGKAIGLDNQEPVDWFPLSLVSTEQSTIHVYRSAPPHMTPFVYGPLPLPIPHQPPQKKQQTNKKCKSQNNTKNTAKNMWLAVLHSEWPKLQWVLIILSVVGLMVCDVFIIGSLSVFYQYPWILAVYCISANIPYWCGFYDGSQANHWEVKKLLIILLDCIGCFD